MRKGCLPYLLEYDPFLNSDFPLNISTPLGDFHGV